MSASVQQIALGRLVLGGSEIAAALGVHPYKSQIELWLEKTGRRAPFAGNEQTDWGHHVEPVLRSWYVETFDVPVWWPPQSLLSVDHPWMRATPDGLVLLDADAERDDPANWDHGFEAKKVGWRVSHRWGDPGTDEVPIEYLLQAQQGMAVTGIARWAVAASIAGEPPTVYWVYRDEELIADMIAGGEEFLDWVASDTEPPIDASADWAAYIAERHPWAREELVQADEHLESLVAEWREVARAIADRETRIAEIQNHVRAAIGSAAGLETSIGKISYKPRAGAPNWRAISAALAAQTHTPQTVVESLAHEHRNAPSRPLLAPRSWNK